MNYPKKLIISSTFSSTAFAYRGRKTITTKDPSKQGLIDTYNRISGFSEMDIKQINLMYKQECGGGGGGRFSNHRRRSHHRLAPKNYLLNLNVRNNLRRWVKYFLLIPATSFSQQLSTRAVITEVVFVR